MPPKSFPTHFLCIPLVNASSRVQLSKSLATLSADVTAPDSFNIPPDAIRPVGTLHLTLGVFSFPKNEGLDRATTLLESLRPKEILTTARQQVAARSQSGESRSPATEGEEAAPRPNQDKSPLSITLRGLSSISSPSKTSVLYAHPVDEQGVLQTFCEKLRGVFLDAELMEDENRPLLLHATLFNTIYVKKAPGEGGDNKRKRGGRRREKLTFDARPFVDRYEDQIWMEGFPVEKIAICKMGAKKVEDDGVEDQVYEAVAEIEF